MKYLIGILLAGFWIAPVSGQDKQFTNELDSVSYSLGVMFGSNMKNAGMAEINDKQLLQGIKDAIGGKEMALTMEQANICLNQYMTKLQEKQALISLVEGQQFLAENAKKEGVITLTSGLQYKIVKNGEGVSPVDTSVVTVHYTGTFINGEVFDSSIERGEPAKFPVNRVIPGWTEALLLMKPGDRWTLYLPSNLAYGENAPQGIGPNKVLVFDVELISFE